MHENSKWLRITVSVLTILAFIIIGYVFLLLTQKGSESPTKAFLEHKNKTEAEVLKQLKFSLVDPGQAPKEIRGMTIRGYEIMLNTRKYAPEFAGNRINCTNCHFAGGDTLGQIQTGISLVGVAAKYPAFDKSFNRVIDLRTRINNCFMRSMNGKAVPFDHDIMLALVTYFHWISKDIPIYSDMPWLGLPSLKTEYQGNHIKGKKLYETYCAICHKEDGQGGGLEDEHAGVNVPPLWGDDSFNKGAGFNRISMLAPFIRWNMPYFDKTPVLSEEEAIDVAVYILSKPRPPNKKDER